MASIEYSLYSSLSAGGSESRRALVDLGALRHNFAALQARIRARAPQAKTIAVVKADAYGHGAPACVCALLECGCDFFAVSCLEEALAVRNACRKQNAEADVLILGYTDPKNAQTLADEGIIQTLLSPDYARALAAEAQKAGTHVRTHVAVDTGMNRIGFCAHNADEIAQAAEDVAATVSLPALSVDGMFTHFAAADEQTADAQECTRIQTARYRALKDALDARGIRIPFHHVCNSAAALTATDTGEPPLFDGVRLGIVLYGGAHHLHREIPLRPVMRLQADVIHVHPLLKGERVGYGGAHVADRDGTVAVLPIGYADGILRAYSGATVTLQTESGRHAVPVIGRVCMDQTFIDVSGIDARVGDTVTFFGETPQQLSALSKRAGTIDYESLCLISARVGRIYENS